MSGYYKKYTDHDYQVTKRYRMILREIRKRATLDEDTEYSLANAVMRLFYINQQLDRINEQQANGFQDWHGNWDEKAELRAFKREGSLLKEALLIAHNCPYIDLRHQGDPRGSAFKLNLCRAQSEGYQQMLEYSGYDTDLLLKYEHMDMGARKRYREAFR